MFTRTKNSGVSDQPEGFLDGVAEVRRKETLIETDALQSASSTVCAHRDFQMFRIAQGPI